MSITTTIVVCTAIICATVFLTAVTLKGMSMGE